MVMNVIRVLLADDHPALRAGIKGMLEKADIEVVGEAADGDEALRLAEELGPDVLVLDAVMPGLRSPQVIHRLRETRPDLRVLVLTAYDENELVFGLLEAGAVGYVLKEEALETIEAAVRAAARGESWLSPKVAAKVMKKVLGKEEAEEAIPLKRAGVRGFAVDGQGVEQSADSEGTLHLGADGAVSRGEYAGEAWSRVSH